jgi:NADH dehydrogenase FAD-containing subunit
MLPVVLVHPGKVILPELGEKLGRYTKKKLSERGLEVRVDTRVTGVTDSTRGLQHRPKRQCQGELTDTVNALDGMHRRRARIDFSK